MIEAEERWPPLPRPLDFQVTNSGGRIGSDIGCTIRIEVGAKLIALVDDRLEELLSAGRGGRETDLSQDLGLEFRKPDPDFGSFPMLHPALEQCGMDLR